MHFVLSYHRTLLKRFWKFLDGVIPFCKLLHFFRFVGPCSHLVPDSLAFNNRPKVFERIWSESRCCICCVTDIVSLLLLLTNNLYLAIGAPQLQVKRRYQPRGGDFFIPGQVVEWIEHLLLMLYFQGSNPPWSLIMAPLPWLLTGSR